MKSALKKILLAAVFYSGNIYLLRAQIKLSKYQVGVSGGVFVYQGDLTPETLGAYKTMKPQLALHIYRTMTPSFAIRLNITRGKLHADEAKYRNPDWRQQRNFAFTTPVTEIAVQGVWNFLAPKSPRLSPYIFAGAGAGFVKINRDFSRMNTEIFGSNSQVQQGLVVDVAKKLPRIIPVVPVGAGLSYAINDRFTAMAESSYRLSFTDYLDGFSEAANPERNDHYLSHSIGVRYSFNKKNDKELGCPKW